MKKRLLIFAIAACVFLGGCTRMPTTDVDQEYALPTPAAEEAREILGQSIEYAPVSVTFNYVSGDGTSFSTIKRFMTPTDTENFCETVLKTLMSSSIASQMTFIPSGTEIRSVEFACGIVTVNLSPDALGVQSETDTLMMLACLTNTLLSIPNVKGANILIGGRPVAIAELPVGVRTEAYAGIAPTYAQMNTENSYFLEQVTGTIRRSAVLYFPSKNGDWLISEMRELEFNSTDYASTLIRALRNGAAGLDSAVAPLPESTDLLINNPSIEISRSGERVLLLELSSEALNYCAMSDLPEWKAIASIVLTVSSFVPDIDAVRITLDGETLTSCKLGNATLNFPDGLIHRADFANRIGGAFAAYLPLKDGSLERTEGALSMRQAASPLSVLATLFEMTNVLGGNSALPKDVSASDILGVSVENEICTVNLSANFYRKALNLNAVEERACIYAMVDTLCALDGIQGVCFLVEGRAVESFAGEIYLKTVLLPTNPMPTEAIAAATVQP